MNYLVVLLALAQGIHGWRNHHQRKHLEFLITSTKGKNVDATEQWFPQILDHMNPDDNRTWLQRYYVNDEFHTHDGPVFLFIGGEGEMTPYWVSNGAWIQYAKQFNALCFVVEHRFYGESQPTGDLTAESLQYLSSKQALYDLKWFINKMNDEYGLDDNTKWIAFGGSYSGNLAAWFRLKFPDFAHGAVASSAPILAKVDFSDYYKVVADALRTHSNECVNVITQAIAKMQSWVQSGKKQQQTLDKKFDLCEPIQSLVNDSKHISTLYLSIAAKFAEAVQYYNRQQKQIANVCNILTNKKKGEPIDRLAAVLSSDDCLYYNYTGIMDAVKNTTVVAEYMFRQWTYQTCTEFGFFATSSAQPSAFGNGFPVEYFIGMCSDTFGEQFNADYIGSRVDDTNRYYGGLDANVTNVVFVHGSIDPWNALGLKETRNPKAPVIFIKGTSHCADMADDNSPEMRAVREKISGYIGQWLSEALEK